MSTQIKMRRGTTSQHSSFTGAEGEVTIDTDKEVAVVHNGSTAGGFPLARADQVFGPTGGTISSANKVNFRDSAIFINSSTDGQLDIVADTEIQIAATTIDINGAINASGEIIAASLDISGNVDIDGITNLDVVDIDGAVNMATTLLVTGNVDFNGDLDVDGTTNLDATNVVGTLAVTGSATISTSSGDSLTLTKDTTEPSLRIEGDANKDFVFTVSGELLTLTQNDGTTDIVTFDHDTKAASFIGPAYVNSGNGSGVALKIGGEGGAGLKTQYIIASGHTNYQIGVATHAASVFSITPSTSAGNTTFTNPALSISAGGQAQFTDGTASLPAISNIGDVNTGILFPAADVIGFSTAGAERARIKADGNLCVGSSDAGNAGQRTISIGTAGSVDGGIQVWARTNGSSFLQFGDNTASANNYRGYIGYKHATDIMELGVLSATRVLINSQGVTSIGTTGTAGQLSIKATGDRCVSTMQVNANGDAGICFLNTSANGAGNIVVNASSVSYGTSSDYRLKENVDYDWDATTRLKQLKPARFNFIADNTNTLVDGFIAHEAQAVVPEAVHGTKDAMKNEDYEVTAAVEEVTDADGNITTEAANAVMGTRSVPDMQGIDQAKLVPLLVKTIQELEARITALES